MQDVEDEHTDHEIDGAFDPLKLENNFLIDLVIHELFLCHEVWTDSIKSQSVDDVEGTYQTEYAFSLEKETA